MSHTYTPYTGRRQRGCDSARWFSILATPPLAAIIHFFAANLNQFQLSIEFNDNTFGVGQQILKSKYFDLAQLEYCNQKIKSVKLMRPLFFFIFLWHDTFSMLSERALYVRERRRRRSEEVEISSPYWYIIIIIIITVVLITISTTIVSNWGQQSGCGVQQPIQSSTSEKPIKKGPTGNKVGEKHTILFCLMMVPQNFQGWRWHLETSARPRSCCGWTLLKWNPWTQTPACDSTYSSALPTMMILMPVY